MDRLRADASLSVRLLAAPALLAVRSAAASVGAARPRGRGRRGAPGSRA